MLKVKPTKTKLLMLKRRVELYRKSHKLLKNKYEILAVRLLELFEEMKKDLVSVNHGLDDSFSNLAYSKMIMGDLDFTREVIMFQGNPQVDVEWESMLGIKLPHMSLKSMQKIDYTMWQTPLVFDSTVKKFRSLLNDVVVFAEKKALVDTLNQEVEKTKRKVNALEQILIPEIEKNISYIEFILEEREREDFVRLKKIRDQRLN